MVNDLAGPRVHLRFHHHLDVVRPLLLQQVNLICPTHCSISMPSISAGRYPCIIYLSTLPIPISCVYARPEVCRAASEIVEDDSAPPQYTTPAPVAVDDSSH
jgi:hypothetical protein